MLVAQSITRPRIGSYGSSAPSARALKFSLYCFTVRSNVARIQYTTQKAPRKTILHLPTYVCATVSRWLQVSGRCHASAKRRIGCLLHYSGGIVLCDYHSLFKSSSHSPVHHSIRRANTIRRAINVLYFEDIVLPLRNTVDLLVEHCHMLNGGIDMEVQVNDSHNVLPLTIVDVCLSIRFPTY